MKTAMSVFAKNLSKIRKLRGLNQSQLAELCSLSLNTIAYYETKRQWPSSESLGKLSEVLKVDQCDFFKTDLDDENFKKNSIPLLTREELAQIVPVDLALEILAKAIKSKPAKN